MGNGLFAISILIIIWLIVKLKRFKKENEIEKRNHINAKNDNARLYETNHRLSKKVDDLIKYEAIIDVESEIDNIKQKAQEDASAIIAQAKNISEDLAKQARETKLQLAIEINESKSKARDTLSNAQIKAQNILDNAQLELTKAFDHSSKIVKDAELKAEEIAGSAYTAMKNAEEYERIVIAMKNTIKGYGDEYLKPTFSLIDDLAEEFGHEEAGRKLKVARERSNTMVLTGNAAVCEYVEQIRRTTAINFVLDAFNGKVDSILSKVKKDNFGILEQKIQDSFYLVNNNGKAFRDARILEEYLSARIEELHLAVIVQELKWQEKEEQRVIREQIREEEKARREFEKAMRDAEKEEQLLKKLIEKAQKEVSKASEAERAAQMERLSELESRLHAAEEKNQRAISMAQQTKAGNVYIISNVGSFGEDVFKIGMTRRLEPLDRVRELGDASVPFEFDVHAMIYSENAPQLERELHRKFLKLQLNKINPRKEFFKVGLLNIKYAVEQLGIEAKWTMAAEAKQYRESLAIEEAMKNNKELEKEWLEFQEEADPVSLEETLEVE